MMFVWVIIITYLGIGFLIGMLFLAAMFTTEGEWFIGMVHDEMRARNHDISFNKTSLFVKIFGPIILTFVWAYFLF